ncbi:repressor LexA [Candidatus Parcubacteria bacterium]|nr:MAG: repressor LexA [Candidatus Parcubacteria bacterium]
MATPSPGIFFVSIYEIFGCLLTGVHLDTYTVRTMTSLYFGKIFSFYRQKRRMPTHSEIAKLVGFKSRTAARKLAEKMISAGYLERDARGRLIPKQAYGEARVLGTVEAGWPSPAEEELIDTMSLDEFLIQNKEATYILKVKGNSMHDAGILEGDMVLVERGPQPKDGDIVIAEVDGEWTMKYFRKQGRSIFLEPANKQFKPIFPKEDLKVAAIVKAVIRKY